jgi:hypothetical protein
MASAAGAETLDFMKEDIYDRIQDADLRSRRRRLHRRGRDGAAPGRVMRRSRRTQSSGRW